jgi:ATP-dependent exoDNAse (exonuclease V) beta subunit
LKLASLNSKPTRIKSALNQNDSLTPSKRQAIAARGNVLVMAGAGTGKTRTLVACCLDCLERERTSLDELLIVAFTEAAVAELRQRLRRAIEEKRRRNPLAGNQQPATSGGSSLPGSTSPTSAHSTAFDCASCENIL